MRELKRQAFLVAEVNPCDCTGIEYGHEHDVHAWLYVAGQTERICLDFIWDREGDVRETISEGDLVILEPTNRFYCPEEFGQEDYRLWKIVTEDSGEVQTT